MVELVLHYGRKKTLQLDLGRFFVCINVAYAYVLSIDCKCALKAKPIALTVRTYLAYSFC